MYLDILVKVPDVKGKITLQRKPKATYVQLEIGREYKKDVQYTNVKRVGIGKLIDEENMLMQPNERYLQYFAAADRSTSFDIEGMQASNNRKEHEIESAGFERNLDKRNALRLNNILKAYVNSSRSYEETLAFFGVSPEEEWRAMDMQGLEQFKHV